uniref:Putative ovule protein n=1 Tax=Solanum chacoense TaxID=4108 RepID=A0A0V0GKK5_SOLCH
MQCLVWCTKNIMHCIIFLKKIFVYKNTLHKHSGKDVKKVLRAIVSLIMLMHALEPIALLMHRNMVLIILFNTQ